MSSISAPTAVVKSQPSAEAKPATEVLRFPRPWLFELQLKPRALALACALVQWTLPSNRGGFCFYSARKLGDLLGWSVPTVERALADLRAAGVLETARRGRRIVAPVMDPPINGDGPERENPINGDGTLNEPSSLTEPRTEGKLSSTVVAEVKIEPIKTPSKNSSRLQNQADELITLFNEFATACEHPKRESPTRKLLDAVERFEGDEQAARDAVAGLFFEDDGWQLDHDGGIVQALKRAAYFGPIGREVREKQEHIENDERRIERARTERQATLARCKVAHAWSRSSSAFGLGEARCCDVCGAHETLDGDRWRATAELRHRNTRSAVVSSASTTRSSNASRSNRPL